MQFQSLINYLSTFISLDENEQDILASKVTHRTYLKNQYMVQQGDVCKYVNFITSGCTKTFYLDNHGTEHIVMFGIENWWIADLGSFITQSPADYNVQCIETTEVIQFTHQNLESLYTQIPKLERFFRKIIERALVASQKRIVRNFTHSAKDNYLIFKELYPKIEQRVPQYMIASYLGITKEFLSKIKSELIFEK